MKALTAILALAGTAGVGYLAYKKLTEKKEETSAYTEYKEETQKGGKLHRASMYAVGTIKTTADKISEGIKQVRSEDMVKKGEETVELIKESGESFKEQVKASTENLYDHIKESSDNVKEEIKETSENIKDELKETGVKIGDEFKETGENIKDELKDIKNLITSINTSPAEMEMPEDSEEYDKDIPDTEIESLDNESSLLEETEITDRL